MAGDCACLRPCVSAARAVALVNAGRLAYAQGDPAASIRLLNEGVQLSRGIGDAALIAYATLNLMRGLHYGGELQSALAISTKAIDLCRQSGDEVLRHWALCIQADLLSATGEYAAPAPLYNESIEFLRRQGDYWRLSFALIGRAVCAWHAGDTGRALEDLIECVRIRRLLDNPGVLPSPSKLSAGCSPSWEG